MELKIEYNKMRTIPPLQQMASHGWENFMYKQARLILKK